MKAAFWNRACLSAALVGILAAGAWGEPASSVAKASSDFQYYAVHAGDTIESVSDHFESNPTEICHMNRNLNANQPLVPGAILLVPLPPPPPAYHYRKSASHSHATAATRDYGSAPPARVSAPRSHALATEGLSSDEAETLYESIVQPVAKGIVSPIAYTATTMGALPASQNVFIGSSGQAMYIPAAPPRPKAEPAHAEEAPRRHSLSSRRAQRTQGLLKSALRFMGVPYVWGGESPSGFDCSGFIQRVFSMNGVAVPRTADLQFEVGQRVPNGEEQPGDVVFFETYCPGASHVGIYLGRHQFVHASSTAGHVTIGDLRSQRFQRCYLGAKRIL